LLSLTIPRDQAIRSLKRAFEHRDRLTERERYLVDADYHEYVTADVPSAIRSLLALVEVYPSDFEALHALGDLYAACREWRSAEETAIQALPGRNPVTYSNLATAQVALGKFEDAERTLDLMAEEFPEHPYVDWYRGQVAASQGDYVGAEEGLRLYGDTQPGDYFYQARLANYLADIARVKGQFEQAEDFLRSAMEWNELRGALAEYHMNAFRLAEVRSQSGVDWTEAIQVIQGALAAHPLDSVPLLDRPYLELGSAFARAGRLEEAMAFLEEFRSIDEELVGRVKPWEHELVGLIALADNHPLAALDEFQSWDTQIDCPICALPLLGAALEAVDSTSSAIDAYERYVRTPWLQGASQYIRTYRLYLDSRYLAGIYERLGTLYDQRGDRTNAAIYYGRFADLLKDADPGLQARVEAARNSVTRLQSGSN
jgi:tetratricopeptide (TPR) repeat protein